MLPVSPRRPGLSMRISARTSSSRTAARTSPPALSIRISRRTRTPPLGCTRRWAPPAPSVHQPPHPDIEHEAHAHERAHEGRPSVAHERQRHSRRRQQPDDDADVEQGLAGEDADHAGGQVHTQTVPGGAGDRAATMDDEKVKRQDQERSEEAALLGEYGEDEIGVLLRQELQLPLRSGPESLAEHAAGTDRDQRLNELVAGSLGVPGRLEKGFDALLLIRLEVTPHEWQGQGRDETQDEQSAN